MSGQILNIGGRRVFTGQQLEIPVGRGALVGRVAYDQARCYFKLVTGRGYWVVLRSGCVARFVEVDS